MAPYAVTFNAQPLTVKLQLSRYIPYAKLSKLLSFIDSVPLPFIMRSPDAYIILQPLALDEILFVPLTFIVNPSISLLIGLTISRVIVALSSVKVLVDGLYFTVPLTPLMTDRSSLFASVTRVPQITRS